MTANDEHEYGYIPWVARLLRAIRRKPIPEHPGPDDTPYWYSEGLECPPLTLPCHVLGADLRQICGSLHVIELRDGRYVLNEHGLLSLRTAEKDYACRRIGHHAWPYTPHRVRNKNGKHSQRAYRWTDETGNEVAFLQPVNEWGRLRLACKVRVNGTVALDFNERIPLDDDADAVRRAIDDALDRLCDTMRDARELHDRYGDRLEGKVTYD